MNHIPFLPDRFEPGTYRVYGITLRSSLPLPADTVRAVAADVEVEYRSQSLACAKPEVTLRMRFERTPQGVDVEYRGQAGNVSRFLISEGGGRIEMKTSMPPVPGLWYVLLGYPLATSLYLRRTAVLHASAVIAGGSVILVAGRSGSGKSATTAAFLTAGAAMLADDLCALTFQEGCLYVQPGYPVLRLSPDIARVLGCADRALPRIFEESVPDDKRWVDARSLPGGFHSSSAPLRAIYILSDGRRGAGAPHMEPLEPPKACFSLKPHGYGWRHLDEPSCITLSWCAEIAAEVPVFRLTMPEGLTRLALAAEAIVRHAESLATAGKP